jgi:hypothetical protein
MNSNQEIRKHILDTYTYLRLGMAGISIIFPLVLWWGGTAFGVPFQTSISSYYHTSMRDIFVGSMITLGSFLLFYQGITKKENFALNCAGILAAIVALTPTELTKAAGQVKCETFIMRSINEITASYVHGVSAMLFFFAIAYVCIATSKTEINHKYQNIYNFLGAGMIIFPIASALLLHFFKETSSLIYFVELAAVVVFSAYWIVKTKEINESQIVRKSLNM